MENISILNFRDTPRIVTKIQHTEIISCKEVITYEASQFSGIFIMLAGTASYELNSKEDSRYGTFPLNNIILTSPQQKLVITPTTQNCQFLHISFDLFEISPVSFTDDNNVDFYKKRRLIILDDCIPISSFEENSRYFQGDVHNLIQHCKLSPVDTTVLCYTLENVLHSMLRVQIHSAINVLKSIHGIAIENKNFSVSEAYNFSLSDIFIWSDSPKNTSNAKIVAATHAKSIYLEKPLGENQYSLKSLSEEQDSKYASYCDVNISNSDHFKVWQFPEKEIPALDKYIKTGVISFKFKSQKVGLFNLFIYQIPTYKNISYTFEITQANVWTEFEIPISKSSEFNILPAYAEKAIQFIQQNYAEKITIQDIANYVRIHPSYLSSLFRKHLNQSVNSYINFHRINIAKQMLRNTDSSITDIALLTGFYDSQHFLKTFKKNTGQTPSEYRNMM